ncbi:MAG: hypothetical protein M1813_000243 [Trichoglossum hirsutum]|jgi:hypothetical protein|nr:MAG: hypothetical protein M1813_000243 [Trichoglossum hirsutum]
MRLSYSRSPASSGCSIDSDHSEEYTHCLSQGPVPTLPAIPARARVRHTDDLDFPGSDIGSDIVALSSGIPVGVERSNSHNTVQISSRAPVIPPDTNTDNEMATRNKHKAKWILASGKHTVQFPISNVYVSSPAGGRGRAKVGGAGIPAVACVLM